MKWFLPILLVAPVYAQTSSVSLAGIELRLGMTKDSVLAKFAAASRFKLHEIETDGYAVLVQGDYWRSAGDLTFRSGKLSRIGVDNCRFLDKPARTLAKAIYSAVASGEKAGLVDVWTGTNDDANSPVYEVHLVFKDREVLISTYTADDIEAVSVVTYYPRVRDK